MRWPSSARLASPKPSAICQAPKGAIEHSYPVLEIWRERALEVTGKALPGGHFLAEEAPPETLAALLDFL